MVNTVDVVRRGTELVVSGGDDGAVSLWDPREKDAITYLQTAYPVLAVAVDQVGSMVYSAGVDDSISAWDVRKLYTSNSETSAHPTPVFSLDGHTEAVTSLAVSPDGQTLLSNAMDSSVRTWSVRPFVPAGQSRALTVYDGAPSGIEQMLLRAVWSPDGARIAAGAGGGDCSCVVWNAVSRRIEHKLGGHRGSVNDVAFAPLEPIIASASSDGTVILGELPR